MFTGIIEQVAPLVAVRSAERGVRLELDLGPLAVDAGLGDSISISGVCLTIAALAGERATFDVSAETLRKTTLGGWRAGQAVNLERALAFGDRLGGHLVSGHVDGVGRLVERRHQNELRLQRNASDDCAIYTRICRTRNTSKYYALG